MTYPELLARLLPARRFGMVFGLERIRALLDALGAPDERMGIVVHVGGTNGKGSTVAMIAALARAAGKRVATYTSPHLSSLRERITFDGAPISEAALCAAAEEVHAHGGEQLTFFEQITAMACVAIAREHVDITILEVGLGGRLDATNAVTPQVAVVTGVAMDHEAILGTTLAAIAAEKAGIFKPNQRIVVGASGEPAAVPTLEAIARSMSSHVTIVDDTAVSRIGFAPAGLHQRRNAAAALAAIDHLEALGAVKVDLVTRGQTLASTSIPGRFEVIGDVILDGAHNPHGALALAATLEERHLRPVLIVAVSADKDARGILSALAPCVSAIIATRYRQERAMDPDALAAIAREVIAASGSSVSGSPRASGSSVSGSPHASGSYVSGSPQIAIPVMTAPDLATADALAREHGTPILVAGSLFLVGEARVRYAGAPSDPIVVSDPGPKP